MSMLAKCWKCGKETYVFVFVDGKIWCRVDCRG